MTGLPPSNALEVTVTGCDTSHRVRYLIPILLSPDPTDPYPGAAKLAGLAREHCSALTGSAMGIGEDVVDLVNRAIYTPDETLWQRGHRVVGCVVYREGGGLLPGRE